MENTEYELPTVDPIVRGPVGRYYGGKWRIAPWIIEQFPPHRIYVELYGGAGSVLLRKPRCYFEVYNDLDGEIVNVFRMLREHGPALVELVRLTPYAREEFEQAYLLADSPLEQARRTLFRMAAGFASGAQLSYSNGFRTSFQRSYTTPADNWRDKPEILEQIVERLRGVCIEHLPALQVIPKYDSPDALYYVDPPYVWSTRNNRNAGDTYHYEMSDQDHRLMAAALQHLQGHVIVSGYASPLYDELFAGWRRMEKETHADGGRDRTEVLWIKPGAFEQPRLF
ncbi:MAG: DNA adenine methylase [Caldilineaceae bacterium]